MTESSPAWYLVPLSEFRLNMSWPRMFARISVFSWIKVVGMAVFAVISIFEGYVFNTILGIGGFLFQLVIAFLSLRQSCFWEWMIPETAKRYGLKQGVRESESPAAFCRESHLFPEYYNTFTSRNHLGLTRITPAGKLSVMDVNVGHGSHSMRSFRLSTPHYYFTGVLLKLELAEPVETVQVVLQESWGKHAVSGGSRLFARGFYRPHLPELPKQGNCWCYGESSDPNHWCARLNAVERTLSKYADVSLSCSGNAIYCLIPDPAGSLSLKLEDEAKTIDNFFTFLQAFTDAVQTAKDQA